MLAACASTPKAASAPAFVLPANPPPVRYGRLSVVGNHLCGSDGQPVQLRGMSTMGLQAVATA
jgi:endoglucanase